MRWSIRARPFAERLEGCRELARAEVLYGKAIEGCRRIHSQHKEIGVLLTELGRCIKHTGDTARAEPILAEAATVLERGPRTHHNLIHLSWSYRMRAEILKMRGEQEKSDALVRLAEDVDRKMQGL
jgi:predicted metal-dependent hydrolase